MFHGKSLCLREDGKKLTSDDGEGKQNTMNQSFSPRKKGTKSDREEEEMFNRGKQS